MEGFCIKLNETQNSQKPSSFRAPTRNLFHLGTILNRSFCLKAFSCDNRFRIGVRNDLDF